MKLVRAQLLFYMTLVLGVMYLFPKISAQPRSRFSKSKAKKKKESFEYLESMKPPSKLNADGTPATLPWYYDEVSAIRESTKYRDSISLRFVFYNHMPGVHQFLLCECGYVHNILAEYPVAPPAK